MAEVKSVRFTKQQLEAIAEMERLGMADNSSEAVRSALDAGLTELGLLNGHTPDTRLRQMTRRFGDSLALLAVFMFGLTWLFPLELRAVAAAPLAASLAMYGLDRLLKHYEPGLSARLGVLRGEKA